MTSTRPTSPGRLLVREELIGFARSKVMLVLWLVLPIGALLGFLALRGRIFHGQAAAMSASQFMGLLVSSLAGTVSALMIAVDFVSERNRNVYVLLAIRPVRRESIVWAKFTAVFVCVTVACIVSELLGIVVDLAYGAAPTIAGLKDIGESLISSAAVVGVSTAAGALFGVMVRQIVVAVVLVLYVGQNAAIVPKLPMLFGLTEEFWLFMVISALLVAILLWAAGRIFRRAQL